MPFKKQTLTLTLEIESVQTRFQIAENLQRLAELYCKETKTGKLVVTAEFYELLEKTFNIQKR